MEPDFGVNWPPVAIQRSVFDSPGGISPSPPSPFVDFGPVSPYVFGSRATNAVARASGWIEESRHLPPVPRPRRREENEQADVFGVPLCERHVVLCHSNPAKWTSDVLFQDQGKLKMAPELSKAVAAQSDLKFKTQLSICEGQDGDALVFPDMLKISGLTQHDVPSIIGEVLRTSNYRPKLPNVERLRGTHVFVACAKGSEQLGEGIIKRLKKELADCGEAVTVWRSARLCRGKKEANVLVYSDVWGVGCEWYGGIEVEDVSQLVHEHILEKRPLVHRWLGCLGLDQKDQLLLKEYRTGLCRTTVPRQAAQQRTTDYSPLSSSLSSSDTSLESGESTDADSPLSSTVSRSSENGSGPWDVAPQERYLYFLKSVQDSSHLRWFPETNSTRCPPPEDAAHEPETSTRTESAAWRFCESVQEEVKCLASGLCGSVNERVLSAAQGVRRTDALWMAAAVASAAAVSIGFAWRRR